MKRKFLVDLGLEADVIDKIMAEHGTTINAIQSVSDGYQDTIKELNSKLENFKDVDVKALNEKIAILTKEKDSIVINNAIDSALTGAKHKELLKSQFQLDDIKIGEGGVVTGLEEQVNKIKENYKDFFEQPQQQEPQQPQQPQTTGYVPANPDTSKAVTTYDSLLQNAGAMTPEQVADYFSKL